MRMQMILTVDGAATRHYRIILRIFPSSTKEFHFVYCINYPKSVINVMDGKLKLACSMQFNSQSFAFREKNESQRKHVTTRQKTSADKSPTISVAASEHIKIIQSISHKEMFPRRLH
jgi:hypothetical protein